jgi:D-cysteine desulfhydrase
MHDHPNAFPLFAEFPALEMALPRISIGDWPTPIDEARDFARENAFRSFWIKREDHSHPIAGGNKVRGLEFLLAEARRRGAKSILTLSSVGSHHICKTAWHARKFGIGTTAVVVPQPPQPYVAANVCSELEMGTELIPANFLTAVPKLAAADLRLRSSGLAPYFMAPGGTTPLACVGHANAAFELRDQIAAGLLPAPDYLYVPMGSLGTAAGLTLGCALAGLKTTIVGVAVSYRWFCTPARCRRISGRTLRLLRSHTTIPNVALNSVYVVKTALGRGYAEITEGGRDWAARLAAGGGPQLDTTYSAKALDGAMQFIREQRVQNKVHLFWHTYHALPQPQNREELAAKLPRALRRYV